MSTQTIDNILTGVFSQKYIDFTYPESTTKTEIFSLGLSNSNDDIFIVFDASLSSPDNYMLEFNKGDFSVAQTPESISFSDGSFIIIPIESGMIKKHAKNATFKITASVSNLINSGLRLAVIKKRFVTNH